MDIKKTGLIIGGIILLCVAAIILYFIFRGKKEGVMFIEDRRPGGMELFQSEDEIGRHHRQPPHVGTGSLAEGTNDGLQPGKYWGIYGAPWQVQSPKVNNQANLQNNME